jgi:hypothetical protein
MQQFENQVSDLQDVSPEAEFFDEIQTSLEFSSLLFTVTSTALP